MHGERIRIARERRRWTRAQLAEAANTTADLIGKYERNDASPSIAALTAIANALGLMAGDLLPNAADGQAGISFAAVAAELDPLPRAEIPEAITHLAAHARLLVSWRVRMPIATPPSIRHTALPDEDLGERPGAVPSGHDRR